MRLLLIYNFFFILALQFNNNNYNFLDILHLKKILHSESY